MIKRSWRQSLSVVLAAAGLSLAALAGVPGQARAAVTPTAAAPSAPVSVGSDIIVALPLDKTWGLLADAGAWSGWYAGITQVTLSAVSLTAGTTFTYQSQGKTISASVVDEKDSELLLWKGAATGPDVNLRWTLKATDPSHTLVSLRAVLTANPGDAVVTQAGSETQAWIGAFQNEAARLATLTPAAKPKKHHKHPAAAAAAPAPTPAAP